MCFVWIVMILSSSSSHRPAEIWVFTMVFLLLVELGETMQTFVVTDLLLSA
jgi:hypothetical protein